VLEREHDVARHQTSHNSGVVHAGIYYAPGSLKARLAVEGARDTRAYCAEHGLPFAERGKLIVATEPGELPRLDELERRGHANGVAGLARLDAAGLREVEPAARGIAALHSPATAVTDFGAIARAIADEVRAAGGDVWTGVEVAAITAGDGGVRLRHGGGVIEAGRAVACAGLWADRLAVASGGERDPAIVPFRGAYRTVVPAAASLVRGLIYPVPDPDLPFLGVHLTRGADGEVHVGPTALLAPGRTAYRLRDGTPRDVAQALRWPGTWRVGRRWWRTGLSELHRAARPATLARDAARYVPALRAADLTNGFAGVRAQAVGSDGALVDDFVVHDQDGVVHVRNAPSPAATAAFPLARLIADRLGA
jgi:2-hydroxyglutarate dehydrogenase